jgi:hypothetical protein
MAQDVVEGLMVVVMRVRGELKLGDASKLEFVGGGVEWGDLFRHLEMERCLSLR